MKNTTFWGIFKKFFALFFVGYISIFSPLVALAQVVQPVSAPVSIPVPIPPVPSPSPTASPIPSAKLSVSPSTVISGNNITVSWNIPNAKKDDYIKILTSQGNKNGSGPLSPSNNCNLNNIAGPNAVKIGSCSFSSAVIVDIGTFKIGYYSAEGVLLAQSQTFQVRPASFGSFVASPTNIGVGSSLNLAWVGINNAHPKDNINYLNNDNYTGTATAHTYWPSNNCAWFTDSITPKPSGTCSIESPSLTGNYKLVYRSGNAPLGQPAPILAVSNVVTVSPSKPDLVILSASASEQLQTGKIATFNITVKNTGKADAILANTNDTFYLYILLTRKSDGKVISTNPYFFVNIASLKAGETKTYTISSQDNITNAGKYTLSAEIDPLKQISESNEGNNKLSVPFEIVSPAPVISSITPSSASTGSIVQASGSNFGSKRGYVIFYNQNNRPAGGAPILDWYNEEVKFKIPAVAKGSYSVEIQTTENRKSNRVPFIVIASQPQITSISPTKLRVGQYLYIYGTEFTSSGKVNFYAPGQTAASASAINSYWSNNLIIVQIPKSLKSDIEYGIQVRTSDERDSSLINIYITK